MRVLTVFNRYRLAGGEGQLVRDVQRRLLERGLEAQLLERSSSELTGLGLLRLLPSAGGLYSREAGRRMRREIARQSPDVVHFHNVYPLWTPSALAACRRAGVPTVLSSHNYGLTCPAWFHFSRGEVCERCVSGTPLWCAARNCCGELTKSSAYALRALASRRLGLLPRNTSRLIVLSEFAASRLDGTGFDPARIEVLPNPVECGAAPADPGSATSFVFAGRLSAEKGVETLLEAARRMPAASFEVAGSGPLERALAARAPSNVRFLGFLSRREMEALYGRARAVVLPSRWFEGCPLVLLEAMALGVPVVASRIGALPELVEDGVTGLLVAAGDADTLTGALEALAGDPERARRLGAAGLRRAAERHDPGRYLDRLLAIYERATSHDPLWP